MGPNWQTFVILFILVVVLFGGKGRISSLMGDMANGIKSFRKGLAEEDEPAANKPSPEVEDGTASPAADTTGTAGATDKTKV
ncbi:MAG: twin-arginine translocase TatA/TatE family subunit [Pseudomonadota bacterium]